MKITATERNMKNIHRILVEKVTELLYYMYVKLIYHT